MKKLFIGTAVYFLFSCSPAFANDGRYNRDRRDEGRLNSLALLRENQKLRSEPKVSLR
jgi:hypothetical protein